MILLDSEYIPYYNETSSEHSAISEDCTPEERKWQMTNQGITQMKYRYCPFCRRQITIRETACRHCGGSLDAGVLKGTDWRNLPVSGGQLKFLKELKIKTDKDITQGIAADLIEEMRAQRPDLFRAYDLNGPAKKGSGCFGKLILLVIIAGGIWAAQHFFHVFDPILNKIKGKIPAGKTVEPEPVKPAPKATPPTSVKPETTQRNMTTPKEEDPLLALENKYREMFRGVPPIGSKIRVKLKGEAIMEGILKAINDKGLKMEVGPALVTLERSRLVLKSRIMLYEDDFITYMIWREGMLEKRKEQAKQSAANLASSKISTGTSKPTATGSKPASSIQTASAAKPSTGEMPAEMPDDMSWKEWMELYGKDNPILQQRLQRVKEHEESDNRTDVL